MRQITRKLIERHVQRGNPFLILDAGCGAGGNLTALAEFGRTLGLDYSPLALGYAAELHREQLAQARVEALPYPDDSFDLVTSFDVIYCLEVDDDQQAISEFARVTRPGGSVLLRVPALPALRGPHDTVVHGIQRYTAPELRAKLKRAGLRVERVTYANSLLLPPIYVARRLQTALVALGASLTSDVQPTPGPINRLLQGLLELEASWIGVGRNFPAGVSLFAVASKPAPRA
jgi:SAM-dependent methyltransferase